MVSILTVDREWLNENSHRALFLFSWMSSPHIFAFTDQGIAFENKQLSASFIKNDCTSQLICCLSSDQSFCNPNWNSDLFSMKSTHAYPMITLCAHSLSASFFITKAPTAYYHLCSLAHSIVILLQLLFFAESGEGPSSLTFSLVYSLPLLSCYHFAISINQSIPHFCPATHLFCFIPILPFFLVIFPFLFTHYCQWFHVVVFECS